MCGGSLQSERAVRSYVREIKAACGLTNAQGVVRYFQRTERWLLDYDLTTCERKVAPPKPTPHKPRVVKPKYNAGMKVVREAVREVERIPQKAPTREKEVSRVD